MDAHEKGGDPRVDIGAEAQAGGGPELDPSGPAVDAGGSVEVPAQERDWQNPQTQEPGAAGGAADGRPTPGPEIEPTDEGNDALWPNPQPD